MSAPLEQLVRLLDEQTDLARKLVEALQADQQLIIRHDVTALEHSNRHKEELVMRLHSTERRRQDSALCLCRDLGLTGEATVARLREHLGAEGQALSDAADRLRAVVAGLRELVAVSHGCLEQSILGIRGLIGLIAAVRAQESGTYNAAGCIASGTQPPSLALRQQV